MPFVKRRIPKRPQPSSNIKPIFIGRTDELAFFVENILKPEDPAYNIISIAGQAGVGKSTLVTRFNEEVHSPNFKDFCSTALVDDRQSGIVSIIEHLAEQLP